MVRARILKKSIELESGIDTCWDSFYAEYSRNNVCESRGPLFKRCFKCSILHDADGRNQYLN